MALFAALCLGLMLLIVPALLTPLSVLAADPPPAPPGRAVGAPAKPPPPAAEREPGWVPGIGEASSPYDQQALQNFDAGSHR